MPATVTALQTGVLSWGTIRGIVTATRSLTGAQRAWVDATLAADPDRRADGGPTVLPNLALLCSAHHQAVHEGGWTPTLHVTTGAMTFTRRGTTLHSHPRLPTTPDADIGPPPPGRPRRHRTTNHANDPPHPPPDQTAPADRPHTAQPAAPLPF